jgi:hypothetical protein
MNDNLLQITPHPTRKELGFVVIFVSCYSFFLSVEAFLRKVSFLTLHSPKIFLSFPSKLCVHNAETALHSPDLPQ